MSDRKPWKHGKVTLGFIRGGTYYIHRHIHGRPFRFSTRCSDAKAALAEYKRFEQNPTGYIPRGETGTEWHATVQEYLAWTAAAKDNSERHIEQVTSRLANFEAFSHRGGQPFRTLESFTKEDIEAFLAALRAGEITGNEVGRASHNRHLVALKGFMRWAREERGLTHNAVDRRVKTVREDKDSRPPQWVEPTRWSPVLENLPKKWKLAAEVQLGSGARYNEVPSLVAEKVLPNGLHLLSKTGQARIVPCSLRTVNAAKQLVDLGVPVPDDEGSQFNHRLAVACRKAGVERFTTHHFRHTFAITVLQSGKVDIYTLQRWMGHADIRTTQKYLRALDAMTHQSRGDVAPL